MSPFDLFDVMCKQPHRPALNLFLNGTKMVTLTVRIRSLMVTLFDNHLSLRPVHKGTCLGDAHLLCIRTVTSCFWMKVSCELLHRKREVFL